jgi:hypothetical protein
VDLLQRVPLPLGLLDRDLGLARDRHLARNVHLDGEVRGARAHPLVHLVLPVGEPLLESGAALPPGREQRPVVEAHHLRLREAVAQHDHAAVPRAHRPAELRTLLPGEDDRPQSPRRRDLSLEPHGAALRRSALLGSARSAERRLGELERKPQQRGRAVTASEVDRVDVELPRQPLVERVHDGGLARAVGSEDGDDATTGRVGAAQAPRQPQMATVESAREPGDLPEEPGGQGFEGTVAAPARQRGSDARPEGV